MTKRRQTEYVNLRSALRQVRVTRVYSDKPTLDNKCKYMYITKDNKMQNIFLFPTQFLTDLSSSKTLPPKN